jgi:pimeloyl-ACP methyl ester carboxylesterase
MTKTYLDVEQKLRPLADPLPPPRPGDWLAEHDEPGQTFDEYRDDRPVRRSDTLHTIYLCFVGDFSEAQRRVLDLTQDYLAIFFDCPVKVNRHVPLASIPPQARRTHPSWGDKQVLTGYILHELLEPERPADALAYLALTASDLWPGRGWNFVFGQAELEMFNPEMFTAPAQFWEDEAVATRFLLHDCPPEVVRDAFRRLRPEPGVLGREVTPLESWPDVPSSYIVCSDDRTATPAWARRAARERLGVEPVEIPGGHCPMLSRPGQLAALLAQGA